MWTELKAYLYISTQHLLLASFPSFYRDAELLLWLRVPICFPRAYSTELYKERKTNFYFSYLPQPKTITFFSSRINLKRIKTWKKKKKTVSEAMSPSKNTVPASSLDWSLYVNDLLTNDQIDLTSENQHSLHLSTHFKPAGDAQRPAIVPPESSKADQEEHVVHCQSCENQAQQHRKQFCSTQRTAFTSPKHLQTGHLDQRGLSRFSVLKGKHRCFWGMTGRHLKLGKLQMSSTPKYWAGENVPWNPDASICFLASPLIENSKCWLYLD